MTLKITDNQYGGLS